MAQQLSTIKHVDHLTTDETLRNRDVATAMPVLAWVRLQPTRSVISSEDAATIMHHICEDARAVPGTLTVATCAESARLRNWLHTDLTEITLCPVHNAEVLFDDIEAPRVITCPAGHDWNAR
jgi:hypothetical protein